MTKFTTFCLIALASVVGFSSAGANIYIDGSQSRIRVFDNDGGSCIYNYGRDWRINEYFDNSVRCCRKNDSDFCWRVGRASSGTNLFVYYSNRHGNFYCSHALVGDKPAGRVIECTDMKVCNLGYPKTC
ncbi:MAG: hypothetical protein JOS17DRAFT_768511 [Linnemannia elongata]|nr:MAG: hypothetical protein JOS17DRAFT_768511 [Linnemannia elongata]